MGETEEVLQNPVHPYTKALLSAVPVPDPEATRDPIDIKGSVSVPVDPLPRCRFYDRCPIADNFCRDSDHPPLEDKGSGRLRCVLQNVIGSACGRSMPNSGMRDAKG